MTDNGKKIKCMVLAFYIMHLDNKLIMVNGMKINFKGLVSYLMKIQQY